MTDRERSAQPIRDHRADDAPHTHRTTGRRWTGFVAHRWPSALGIAVAALTAYDMDRADDILLLSPLVVLMALVYVGSAALDRRWFAWVVLFAGLALLSFFPSTSRIDPSVVLLIAAAGFLVVGRPAGCCGDPADSRSRPPGCWCSARACW